MSIFDLFCDTFFPSKSVVLPILFSYDVQSVSGAQHNSNPNPMFPKSQVATNTLWLQSVAFTANSEIFPARTKQQETYTTKK